MSSPTTWMSVSFTSAQFHVAVAGRDARALVVRVAFTLKRQNRFHCCIRSPGRTQTNNAMTLSAIATLLVIVSPFAGSVVSRCNDAGQVIGRTAISPDAPVGLDP
jgi:hypothetical protein